MYQSVITSPNQVDQLMVNWWFGILGIPLSNNPFHKGIQGIQTTGPQTTNIHH